MRHKTVLFLFLLLSILNGFIFYFKDRFQYIPYASYNKLYKPCNDDCLKKWHQYVIPYGTQELQTASHIAATFDSSKTSTLDKIVSISQHLYEKFHAQNGKPSEAVNSATPIGTYHILSSNKREELQCGQYAQMFSFFCWSQNIICRNIEIMRPDDHHVINECYVPELNKWVMVDVLSGFYLSRAQNQYLDIQQFLKVLETNQPIAVLISQNNKLQTVNLQENFPQVRYYYKSIYPFYYYYFTDLKMAYGRMDKLKRYVLPQSWFEVYTPVKQWNILFYIKEGFLILWFLLLLITLIQFAQGYDRSKKFNEGFWR